MKYFADKGYNCVALSFRNHGNSFKVKNMNSISISDYITDLKNIVDTFDNEPIIIAHSMGGLVLQKYLEKYSCKAAVLMAPVPITGVLKTTLGFITKKWNYSIPSLITLNLYGLVNSVDKSKWAFFSDNLPKDQLTKYTNLLSNESYLAFLNMLFPNVKLNFHKKRPMLIIAAENDNIFSVSENKLSLIHI